MNDNTDSMDVLDYQPKANPETGRELLPNPQRGCGYLETEKAYVRTDPVRHPDGEIPSFVVFKQPIPYKEGTLRSFQQFDGTAFQRSTSHNFDTIPEDDLSNLWDRLEDSEDGDHWGAITTAYAEDLLMWSGETYYNDPLDFIQEARQYGLSKAIPVSKRQEPPAINPMKTRVFIVHPTAYRLYEQVEKTENDEGDVVPVRDENGDKKTKRVRVSYRDDDNRLSDDDAEDPVKTVAGVIGYSYLTRVVWTAPSDGEIPKWAEQYQDTGQLDIVDVGEPVPDDVAEQRLDQLEGSLNDPEIRRKADNALAEAGKTLTPGHGADVDADAADDDGDDPADADDTEPTDDRSDAADEDWVQQLRDDHGGELETADFRAELPGDFHLLRSVASAAGVSPEGSNPGKDAIEQALAEARILRGPVGDDRFYRLTDDGVERIEGDYL